jgi:hypothetical protein
MEGLLPPRESERARPGSRSYADLQQRVFFVSWLAEAVKRSGLTRKEIARQLWPESADSATTHPIKLYTEVRVVDGKPVVNLPAPQTLRSLCRLLDLSWTEAFALAGYYRELLQAIADLADLGYQWIAADTSDDTVPKEFYFGGVSTLGGLAIDEALALPQYAQRYVIGYWEEGPFGYYTPPEPPEGDDQTQSNFFNEWLRANADQVSCVRAVIPKPLAIAILIAVAGFPRRGDLYKDASSSYAAELLNAAGWIIDEAQARTRLRGLPPLLQRADDALRDRNLRLEAKRVIAAEYTVAWADRQCSVYTHVARLAAMARFGVAGSSVSTQNGEELLPDIRRAFLPGPEAFQSETPEPD